MFTREDQFEKFWAVFPKKVKKPYAKRCFMTAIKKTDIDTMLAGVERHKVSDQWRKGFIENPSTWLNNEMWNDVIETPSGMAVAPPFKVTPTASEAAIQQQIETRRRRAEMSAAGMSDDEIEAVFEREYEERRR